MSRCHPPKQRNCLLNLYPLESALEGVCLDDLVLVDFTCYKALIRRHLAPAIPSSSFQQRSLEQVQTTRLCGLQSFLQRILSHLEWKMGEFVKGRLRKQSIAQLASKVQEEHSQTALKNRKKGKPFSGPEFDDEGQIFKQKHDLQGTLFNCKLLDNGLERDLLRYFPQYLPCLREAKVEFISKKPQFKLYARLFAEAATQIYFSAFTDQERMSDDSLPGSNQLKEMRDSFDIVFGTLFNGNIESSKWKALVNQPEIRAAAMSYFLAYARNQVEANFESCQNKAALHQELAYIGKKYVAAELAWDKDSFFNVRSLLLELTSSLPRAEDIMNSFGDLKRVSPPSTKPNTPNLSQTTQDEDEQPSDLERLALVFFKKSQSESSGPSERNEDMVDQGAEPLGDQSAEHGGASQLLESYNAFINGLSTDFTLLEQRNKVWKPKTAEISPLLNQISILLASKAKGEDRGMSPVSEPTATHTGGPTTPDLLAMQLNLSYIDLVYKRKASGDGVLLSQFLKVEAKTLVEKGLALPSNATVFRHYVREVFLDYIKRTCSSQGLKLAPQERDAEIRAVIEYIVHWREHLKYELKQMLHSGVTINPQIQKTFRDAIRVLGHIAPLFEVSLIVSSQIQAAGASALPAKGAYAGGDSQHGPGAGYASKAHIPVQGATGQFKQSEIDDIMIIKLLKSFKSQFSDRLHDNNLQSAESPMKNSGEPGRDLSWKEGEECLGWIYDFLRVRTSKVHHNILNYFRTLLIKVYLFNRKNSEKELRFLKSLSKLTEYAPNLNLNSAQTNAPTQYQMNRTLQQNLGLWIPYYQNQGENQSKDKMEIIKLKEQHHTDLILILQTFIGSTIEQTSFRTLYVIQAFDHILAKAASLTASKTGKPDDVKKVGLMTQFVTNSGSINNEQRKVNLEILYSCLHEKSGLSERIGFPLKTQSRELLIFVLFTQMAHEWNSVFVDPLKNPANQKPPAAAPSNSMTEKMLSDKGLSKNKRAKPSISSKQYINLLEQLTDRIQFTAVPTIVNRDEESGALNESKAMNEEDIEKKEPAKNWMEQAQDFSNKFVPVVFSATLSNALVFFARQRLALLKELIDKDEADQFAKAVQQQKRVKTSQTPQKESEKKVSLEQQLTEHVAEYYFWMTLEKALLSAFPSTIKQTAEDVSISMLRLLELDHHEFQKPKEAARSKKSKKDKRQNTSQTAK